MGEKVGLAYNDTEKPLLFSFNNIAFSIKESANNLLLPQYLYMYFNRSEFDRYAICNSWGSATELFSFEEMCDIDITLPDIEKQWKYVNVYLGLKNNLAAYQSKVDDLKFVFQGYMNELKKTYTPQRIINFIENIDERNTDLRYTNVKGLTVYKQFIDTKANLDGVSLHNYKVVLPGNIAYVSTTNRNGDRLACGFCDEPCIISQIYDVIKVSKTQELLPEYLFMWFIRSELDRYARYNSWGSAREFITWEDLGRYSIPIPPLDIQQDIVNIHKCYIERQRIALQLKDQLNRLCPLLIKGSLQTAN